MEIIKPSVELLSQGTDIIAHVAKCARVCYGSDKTIDNERTYKNLLKSKHYSMFRHESRYFIVNYNKRDDNYYTLCDLLEEYTYCPYIDYHFDNGCDDIYIATNGHFLLDHEYLFNIIHNYEVDEIKFMNTKEGFKLMRYTFKIITQISTSRELNRVSPNNIAEQSTRYVNLNKNGGAICQPHWVEEKDIEDWINGNDNATSIYYHNQCQLAFDCYNELISLGMKPEDARGVLPLDTATVCIYTYSIKEWKHIIDLRYYGKTGKPHPNAKIIAGMIKKQLNELGYNI